MSTKHIILITLVFFSTLTQAQNNSKASKGFYGKRVTIQMGGGIHHNSLIKISSHYERNFWQRERYDQYRKKNGTDQFNYSVYGNIGFVLGNRSSLSFDFNYYFGNLVISDFGSKQYYDYMGNYVGVPGYNGRIKYNTMRIMPRIEINANKSGSQVGLVNILGAGVELTKAKSGTYDVMFHDEYDYTTGNINNQIMSKSLSFIDEFAINVTFMYGLEYRLPITKNIAWNFGGYIHLNLPITGILHDFSSYNYMFGIKNWDDEIKYRLVKNRVQNLFSIRSGLVIML